MNIEYEINGSIFKRDKKGELSGELYTLTNQGKIDPTDTARYKTLEETKVILDTDLSEYERITVYQWVDDEINMFYEYK